MGGEGCFWRPRRFFTARAHAAFRRFDLPSDSFGGADCIDEFFPARYYYTSQGPLAQVAERQTFNLGVTGSSPVRPIFICSSGANKNGVRRK
jgi:hypothetical protein